MAVLFPRARAWKNSVLRRAAARLRHLRFRFRLRRTAARSDLTLRATGVTTADALFEGEPAPLRKQTAAHRSRAGTIERWLIYPHKISQLVLPKTIEEHDEGGFLGWENFHHPPAYVYRIPKGLYHGHCGAVVDDRGRLFSDILDADPRQFSQLTSEDLLPQKTEPQFSERNAIALSSSQNYYHWLIKMLPRLHLAEQAGVDIQKSLLLINRPIKQQAEGYASAGLSSDALRVVKAGQYCCCENLFVSSVPHDVPSWAIEYLRRTFAPLAQVKTRERSKAIYLSRRTAPTRRVLNEEAVGAYLATVGVEVIDLSERSFAGQIETLAQADLIIAPHGAALSNLAFARSGTRLLEIFSNAQTQKCFWIMSRHLGITYHYFVAETVPRTNDPEITDMIIPIEKLKRALDYLLADPLET